MIVVNRRKGSREPESRTAAKTPSCIRVAGKEYVLETCRAHRARNGKVRLHLSWMGRKGRQMLHSLLGIDSISVKGDSVVIEHPDKGLLTLKGVKLAEELLDVA